MSLDTTKKDKVLSVNGLTKKYDLKTMFKTLGTVNALSGISFDLYKGETLAIVGESGCGKSTLAKLLMNIEQPTEGDIQLKGQSKNSVPSEEYRKIIQMIFQDPYSSINPRKKAWEIISEPLAINSNLSAADRRKAAEKLMFTVGLRPDNSNRFPHMFSGGQRQRIGVARALVMQPEILICDEPVSALDVSIQAQILNLLLDLQKEMQLSYIFISHDLSVVKHICDRVMVIYLGKVVEYGTREQVLNNPQHPYTKTLLASSPSISGSDPKFKDFEIIKGEIPSKLNPPKGCSFHKRCPYAGETCLKQVPKLAPTDQAQVSCFLYQN